MRLTDAEELINILEWNRGQEKDALVSINSLIKLVKERPTAYNVDKVVEQLEDRSKEYNSGVRLHGKPEEIITNEAIKIVKGGGLDSNCSNVDEFFNHSVDDVDYK